MPATVKELREKRAVLYDKMQSIVDTATSESRGMTSEEQTTFASLDTEQDALLKTIESAERTERMQADLEQVEEDRDKHDYRAKRTGGPTVRDYQTAFQGWALGPEFRSGKHVEAGERCGLKMNNPQWQLGFSRDVPKCWGDVDRMYATRATTQVNVTTDNTLGAYAVQNEPMRAIERALLAFGGMRESARVIRTRTGATLQIPMNNDTGNKATIVGQGATIDISGIEYTQMTLGAYKYSSGLVKVSVEFLQDLSYDFGGWIGSVLGERVARGTNTDFTIGVSSSGEPAGAATQAIDPASTSTQLTYDGLVKIEHRLDPAYRRLPGCRWMFHDSVLRRIKQLTDSQGRLLWVPGVAAGEPDTILGYPYTINQDMATDSTAGATKQILFGDFQHYIVRDVMDVQLRRLDERYAEAGLVAFFTLSRHDGGTVIPSTATPPIIAGKPTT